MFGRKSIESNILIDGNNIIHRIFHAFVKSDSNRPLVTGVFDVLSSWIRKIPNRGKIFLFLDGKPEMRLRLDPSYKNREREPIFSNLSVELSDGFEAKSDFDAIVHLFGLFGVDIFWHPHEEADDLISSFVKQNCDKLNIIISSDKDFYQLVNDNVILFRPKSNSDNWFYDPERVYEEGFKDVKVRPNCIRLFKSLTGDTSDNIPGVPRLRRLIAANLSQNLTIDALYASGFPGCSKRERNLIINMRPRIDLNYELVGFRNIDPLDNFKIESTENFEIADEILRKNFNSVIDSSAFKVGSGKKIIISDSLGFLDPV